jgi:DNA-directed RNA polymerase
MTLKDDQEVYALMQQLGDKRLSERLVKARASGNYSETAPGSFLAASMAGRLEERINHWILAQKTRTGRKDRSTRLMQAFADVGVMKAASLTCRYVVDSLCVGQTSATRVHVELGQMLEAEMRMSAVAKLAPRPYRYSAKTLRNQGTKRKKQAKQIFEHLISTVPDEDQGSIPEWSEETRFLMGYMLLAFVVQISGVIQSVRLPGKGRKGEPRVLLSLKPSTIDWIHDAEAMAKNVIPLNLPMLSPPRPWTTPYDGGYSEDFVGRRTLVSSRHKAHIRALDKAICPAVYDTVNTLQEVPWSINKRVLEVMRTAFERRWSEDSLKFPNWEAEVYPTKPPEGTEKGTPLYRVFAREFRQAKVRENENKIRSFQVSRILYLGDVYSGSPLYFVHMLDFRGRAYPLGGGLQYQGDDRQRGILQFAEGKPIVSAIAKDWFHIHGANCWGTDKVSFADRIGWVEKNVQKIKDVAADPIANRWWIEADKPWQFLAWCFEAADYWKNPDTFLNHIPVGMDGSNNGLQLYSLILRDPVGGAATNCIPSDKPQDIYLQVAKKVNTRLAEVRVDPGSDPQHRRWADQLLSFWPEGLPRSAVKRPVMTLVYGATKHSCQRYVSSWYHDEVRGKRLNPPPFPNMDAYNAMTWISGLVWEAIEDTVVAARDGMAWLRDLSDLFMKHGHPPTWVAPSGFPVHQYYKKGKKHRVKFTLGRPLTVIRIKETEKLNTLKHRDAIAPNFIHSLDASLMTRTVLRAKEEGVTAFMMIHDSFATHAADAGIMADVIRDEAIQMFSGNPLEDLRQQAMEILGVEVPPPPPQGSLDIELLRLSRYFFA